MAKWTLKIILTYFYLSSCYWNKTFFEYDYAPTQICSLDDPWNQSKFGGPDYSSYIHVLEGTGWNMSEIAFKCIYSDREVYEAFGSPESLSPYDYYMGTFGGWIITPITVPFQYTQPMQENKMVVVASYSKPFWIFFKKFDAAVLVLLLLTSIFLGVALGFLNSKRSNYYQVSNYAGYIFFQPEILEKHNASIKIILIAFQIMSLIVLTVFIYTLQISFDEMRTYGKRTMENGLQDVRIYTNEINIYRVMASTLTLPFTIGVPWLDSDGWKEFVSHHEGGTFIFEDYVYDMLSIDICSLNYVGDVFTVFVTVYFGRGTRQELRELEESILDTAEFHHKNISDYFQKYKFRQYLSKDEIKCKEKKTKIFQYTISDFISLWYIYTAGTFIAAIVYVHALIFEKCCNESLDLTKSKAKAILKNFLPIFHQSLLWLRVYQFHFVYYIRISRLKKFRQALIKKDADWANKLSKARSKVVVKYIKRSKKRFFFRSLVWLLVALIKSKKIKKRSKKSMFSLSGRKIAQLNPNKVKISKSSKFYSTNKAKYSEKLIKIALKESFFNALRLMKICNIEYETQIEKCIRIKAFNKKVIVKLKEKHKRNYKFSASMHSQLKKLFFHKIFNLFYEMPGFRKCIDEKTIAKNESKLRVLAEELKNKELVECYPIMLTALNLVIRNKLRKNNKKILCKKGVQAIPKFYALPNNLKIVNHQ